jgi:hypothetical protein
MRYLIFLFLVFSFACRQKKVSVKDEGIMVSPSEVGWEVNMYSVSGNVTQSKSYCGGARPTDAILQEITTPKPLANSIFYIRKGKGNNPASDEYISFKTDENGNFDIKLLPGDYVIIEQNRLDSSYYFSVLKTYSKETDSYSNADTLCMQKWLSGSLAQFTVKDADVKNISWDIHSGCYVNVPCVHYKGPLPP